MQKQFLQNYLHQNIPLSQAMGLEVLHCESQLIELKAPLSLNFNHKGTAFGGSLSTLGITAGWAFLFAHLENFKNEIVIHKNEMLFSKPAEGDFRAICFFECFGKDSAQWKSFMSAFESKKKARLELNVDLWVDDLKVASLVGNYVAFNLG